MLNTIHISAQTFENYGTEMEPHWKPKGEQKFSLKADADYLFYGEEIAIGAIDNLLRMHSSVMMKFKYISHEIVFHDIIELNNEQFVDEYDKIAESLQK